MVLFMATKLTTITISEEGRKLEMKLKRKLRKQYGEISFSFLHLLALQALEEKLAK